MITIQDVVAVATEQKELELRIEDLEAVLKEAKERDRRLSQEILPNMLDELGLSSLKLADGSEVTVKDEVYAKLPSDSFKAFEYLRQTNNDGIIKTQVAVDFGKGETDQAQHAAQVLTEMGLFAQVKETIHPQTLKAFIREQISRGVGIELSDFGATIVKTTVIRFPK